MPDIPPCAAANQFSGIPGGRKGSITTELQLISILVRTVEQYLLLQAPHPLLLGLLQTLHLRRSPASLRSLSPVLRSQSFGSDTGRTYVAKYSG
jgi:hypothetical protein